MPGVSGRHPLVCRCSRYAAAVDLAVRLVVGLVGGVGDAAPAPVGAAAVAAARAPHLQRCKQAVGLGQAFRLAVVLVGNAGVGKTIY